MCPPVDSEVQPMSCEKQGREKLMSTEKKVVLPVKARLGAI